ncbi:MAG: amidohydrolase [Bacteroidetes bacterium]|nr:amidohydrolase [Bacteroidota bacterium]
MGKYRKQIVAGGSLLLLLVAGLSFRRLRQPAVEGADRIYIKGRLLTMDANNSIVQAVAIKDGKILATGNTADIEKYKDAHTEVIDLAGKTMVPGLIDGHSHFMALGLSDAVNIFSPPAGPVKNFSGIMQQLKEYIKLHPPKPGEWVTAFGYDPDQLEEKRHPEKEDIDKDFPDIPVMLIHASGHMCVVNSAALRVSGVTAATPDPAGGQLVRKKGSSEPTGLLLENGRTVLKINTAQPTLEQQLESVKRQQLYYAGFGITTAQDGYSSGESITLLKKAASMHLLNIDIETLPGYPLVDTLLKQHDYSFGELKDHFKMAGFKLVADGSPQGKTAYMSKPYLTAVPGCSGDHCTGIPVVNQSQIDAAIEKGFRNNVRTFVHCNGDATIDMYIHAVNRADSLLHTSSVPRRPVVIHSQFVRPDQLDTYSKLGMMPAFFTNHAFFWGDTHIQNLGEKRADYLSPLKSAMQKHIMFTNHTDYPVTPINQMFLLWTSVVRKSRTGQVMGAAECLTPMEGLRAITINGAYEYGEEKIKGSIEKGKLADLAILNADPLTIEADKIKDIAVLETIKEGKTVFKKP